MRRKARDEALGSDVAVDRRPRRTADHRAECRLETARLVAVHVLERARKAEGDELVEDLLEPVETFPVPSNDEHPGPVLFELDICFAHPVELIERSRGELEQRGDTALVGTRTAAAREMPEPADPRRIERRPDDERAARVERRA